MYKYAPKSYTYIHTYIHTYIQTYIRPNTKKITYTVNSTNDHETGGYDNSFKYYTLILRLWYYNVMHKGTIPSGNSCRDV